MELGSQNINSFHLAGIVPVAGQKLDFNFPWHDSLQPIAANYLAVERAVVECAYAGCETIWIVCHDNMQPLIRYRLGDYVQDPTKLTNTFCWNSSEHRKTIPIFYVPIHPKDQDKRDCLAWSILYGANSAYWINLKISKWTIPSKYYVAFPYGVYQPWVVKEHRKKISSKNRFFLSYNNKTIKNGEYLGFTFDGNDFKKFRNIVRKQGTGEKIPVKQAKIFKTLDNKNKIPIERLPIDQRWSARFFTLEEIFKSIETECATIADIKWYYNIDNWEKLCHYLGSEESKIVKRPSKHVLSYREYSKIGEDNGDCEQI